MQLLNNIYLFELGVVTRKVDFVACKNKSAYQCVLLRSLIDEYVMISVERITIKFVTCKFVISINACHSN